MHLDGTLGEIKETVIDMIGGVTLSMKKILHKIKPPCPKCPYTLGQIHTLRNPCPECKANGYQMYERFQKQNIIHDNSSVNINKMISIEGLTPGQIYANIYNASTIEENTLAFRQMIALTSKEMETNPTVFDDMKNQGIVFFHNLYLRLFGY